MLFFLVLFYSPCRFRETGEYNVEKQAHDKFSLFLQ